MWITACWVAEAQAANRGLQRMLMVEWVVHEVSSGGQLLGVRVVVAHVRVVNQALAGFHQRAQAVGVAERGRGLGTALLLGLRLVGGRHGGGLGGVLGG